MIQRLDTAKLALALSAGIQLALFGDLMFEGNLYRASPITLFVLLTLVPIIAFVAMRRVEDDSPDTVVRWQKVMALLFIVAAIVGHCMHPQMPHALDLSGDWLQQSSLASLITSRASGLSQAGGGHSIDGVLGVLAVVWQSSATIIGYALAAFFLLSILRTLERRPSLATFFIWNATALVALSIDSHALLVAGILMASLCMIYKERWNVAFALLSAGVGLGLIAALAFVLMNKHHESRIKPEERPKAVALAAGVFLITGIIVGPIAGMIQGWSIGTPLMPIVSVVLAFIGFVLIQSRRPDVTGRDSLAFALMMIMTILAVALQMGQSVIYLLPLAALFRSLPQLWLAFAVGLMTIAPMLQFSGLSGVVTLIVFLAFFIPQLIHAYRETGLFKVIEVKG